MGDGKEHLNRGDCLSPTATGLLWQPLEFIREDHLRERQICVLIDEIASGGVPDKDTVNSVLGFLKRELPLHLKDEEEDLFPLLLQRCEPDEEIGKVIDKLLGDHAHAGQDTPSIIAILEELTLRDRSPSEKEREAMLAYAAHSRRHLILENAIILPISRLRLTAEDLQTLTKGMCHRRNLEPTT